MAFSPHTSGKAQSGKKAVKRRSQYERRIWLYSFLVGFPAMLVALVLIWLQSWSVSEKLGLLFALAVGGAMIAAAMHDQTVRPLQTLANVVAALREEDYSFRARGAAVADALGEVPLEVNSLADLLADQRLRAIEAPAVLRRVVEEIDAPLFAFGPDRVIKLVNPAGEKLLQQPAERLIGRTADETGLGSCLDAPNEGLM